MLRGLDAIGATTCFRGVKYAEDFFIFPFAGAARRGARFGNRRFTTIRWYVESIVRIAPKKADQAVDWLAELSIARID
jgi:hypothetical protein